MPPLQCLNNFRSPKLGQDDASAWTPSRPNPFKDMICRKDFAQEYLK